MGSLGSLGRSGRSRVGQECWVGRAGKVCQEGRVGDFLFIYVQCIGSVSASGNSGENCTIEVLFKIITIIRIYSRLCGAGWRNI